MHHAASRALVRRWLGSCLLIVAVLLPAGLSAPASSGLSNLALLHSGGTQCTPSTESPASVAGTRCSDAHGVAIQPGTESTLVWDWAPLANASQENRLSLFLQDESSLLTVADNVNPADQQCTFAVPTTPVLRGLVIVGVIINGTRITTMNAANALAAANPSSGSSIARIALILGLCSVFGLAFLLCTFFGWRKWIRKQPGFARRKQQRKQGFSTVVAGRLQLINSSLQRSLGRRSAAAQHSAMIAEGGSDLEGAKPGARTLSDIALQPPAPCFRPSADLVPPRLCRTYTWQQDAPSGPPASPPAPRDNNNAHALVHGEEESEDLLPGRPGRGWDD